MESVEIAIVGGGIVGMATALELTRRQPGRRLVVLEKEPQLGSHQSGHNSGVLHSGIYYKPGSLKAKNCRAGKEAMEQFCADHGVDYDICGKVIVAVREGEREALHRIYDRGQKNGVACELIGAERLTELEPHAVGVEAIHVPEAGIVNYRQVCEKMGELVRGAGGTIVNNARVNSIRAHNDACIIDSTAGEYEAKILITCAGLHCDRVSRMSGHEADIKVVPFRGEFYKLKPQAQYLCRNLIYPVPDPAFPFLGVHFTRMIEGGVECGPNAVLAFAREGYRKRDVNLRDLGESLMYPGFRRLAFKYWRVGLGEIWRSFSKAAFVKALQRLMPEIRGSHLVAARAGVRAQSITPDGDMVDDFLIQQHDHIINVCNAPSPAATSSLNIGRLIADRVPQDS